MVMKIMNTNIQKWGNSLAVRIPSHIANKLSMQNGDSIELIANDHQIIIKSKKHVLANLIDQITPENLHNSEWENTEATGKETW